MNPPSRTPSRASTAASQNPPSGNTQNAALSGATRAFARPVLQQRTGSTTNGAFAVATSAGTSGQQYGQRRGPATPLVPSSTGGSARSVRRDASPGATVLRSSGMPSLRPALPDRSQNSPSPSLQAASVAASRAKPQHLPIARNESGSTGTARKAVRKPAAPPKPRQLSEHYRNMAPEEATDDSPIPPTTSLVNLFERRGDQSNASGKKPEPIVVRAGPGLAIKSPQPIRTSGGLTSMSMFQMDMPDTGTMGKREIAKRPSSDDDNSSKESFASASEVPTAANSPDTVAKKGDNTSPLPMPANHAKTLRAKPLSPTHKPISTSVGVAKPLPRPSPTPSQNQPPSPPATQKSLPAQYNQRYPRLKPPQLTSDHLANAMVASSLASSRVPSPKHHLEPQPPPPPHRRKPHTLSFSRTPSPTKAAGMRQTMRKADSASSSSDEDPYGKHKKKRHLRKHPNKHHEGARKRWRDAVTERERKRYEGVWAANKGLYCTLTTAEQASVAKHPDTPATEALQASLQDQVSNLVVREIWRRSRLPEVALEAVWDLVDGEGVGRLGKVEFVVGMWLVDQGLKGRKIPSRVGETVWASVRGLVGVKVRVRS